MTMTPRTIQPVDMTDTPEGDEKAGKPDENRQVGARPRFGAWR
jgi:hypothetical protein